MSNPPSTTLTTSVNVTYQPPEQLEGIGPRKNENLLHARNGRINGSVSLVSVLHKKIPFHIQNYSFQTYFSLALVSIICNTYIFHMLEFGGQ